MDNRQNRIGEDFIWQRDFKKISLKKKCFFLDGDEIRYYLNNDLGYSLKDRKENSLRIQKLCNYLEKKNYLVICCIQSLFKNYQKKNRKIFRKYLQIFIKVTNQNNYLKKFKFKKRNRNVVGKDIIFPEPFKSDIILENDLLKKNEKLNFLFKKIKKKM